MALATEHNAFEPGSEAFTTCNPGLLKSHEEGNVFVTEDGIRIFTSFQGGHRALITNLTTKCSGATKANGDPGKLSPTSTLSELCKTYQYINVSRVVSFLIEALKDKAITPLTPIGFFLN